MMLGARNAARLPARQWKKYRSGWCQLMFSFRSMRPQKGRQTTGNADPRNGSRQIGSRREKLRRAAGRLLVAGIPVRDLLLRAKHLFVAATVGCAGEIQPWVFDERLRGVTRCRPSAAAALVTYLLRALVRTARARRRAAVFRQISV